MIMNMAVRKIKGSWWVDIRFNRRRYRLRSPEDSRQGAQAYETLVRHKMVRGEPFDPKPQRAVVEKRFGEFAMEWLEMHAKVNNKPSTIKAKESTLRIYLLPYFGGFRLGEIDGLCIEKFKAAQMARKLSAKSINCHLGILLTCLKTAQEWDQLEKVPRIALLKLPPRESEYLTPQEATKLFSVKKSMVQEMVLCALRTGMRIGEICALDWEDIDFESGIIKVRRSLVNGVMGSPKNNKVRHIPMSSDLRLTLALRQKRAGFVFTRDSGGCFTSGTQWKVLQELCLEAGVRQIGWHVLRHTFATTLSNNGAPMRAVQKLMGHSTLQMTEHYSHVDQETLTATIGLLQRPSVRA